MKSAELLHMVIYENKDLVGFDLKIEGNIVFFTVEELKIALKQEKIHCDQVFLSPLQQLRHSPYLPERNMDEEELYAHPCLSHRENLDMLEGIPWKRHYHYEKKEDGTYLATFFQGQGIAPVYARPSLHGQPVTTLQWIFQGNIPDFLEEIIPFLPSSPLESVLLGVEEEGKFLPCLLWICGVAEEVPEKIWANQGELQALILGKSIKIIGNTSFSTCPKLKTVHLPPFLEEIREHAFSYTAIEKMALPPSLHSIGPSAFSRCGNLTEITLPKGISVVSEACFAHNKQLKSVIFPSGLEKIEKNAFTHCGLETVILPEGLEEIGNDAFSHCPNLRRVYFPSSLKRIGNHAFAHSGIQEISLGENVTFLGFSAFEHCTQLKSLSLCENSKSIGNYAFSSCQQLKKLTFTPSFGAERNPLFLGAWSFHQTGLEEVIFPKTLVEIEEKAFFDCKFLWNAEFPEGLAQIGDAAFAQTSLLTVKLPSTVTTLGEEVFQDCPLIFTEGIGEENKDF